MVLAVGSRGDLQPYVSLGLGLKAAGHRVQLATHASFEGSVTGHGLGFSPLEGDPRQIIASEAGQAWLESGHNPLRYASRFLHLFRPLMERSLAAIHQTCLGADAIVYSPLAIPAYHVAEALGIPSHMAALQPLTPTRAFPMVQMRPTPRLGGTYNLLTHVLSAQLFWQPLRAIINRWRTETLNLPPLPFQGLDRKRRHRLSTLYGFSAAVIPRPADWPACSHVTGYWFLDRPSGWRPPAELVDFLEAGPAPVYVGFGSMIPRDAETLTRVVIRALAKAGQRGVLMTGWAGLSQEDLPYDVFKTDSIPHDWLFPRMAAVVHHGGAGTTAAGLRAGVPSVVVPFFADQPFWAHRLHVMGVAPSPIPHKRLTEDRLASAIREATGKEEMRKRAAAVGEQIRTEDGVARAVEIIHRQPPTASATRLDFWP